MHPANGGFHVIRKTRLSWEIIGQVQGLLASGRLKPGDRLPPRRELARSLGVAHTTVNEAIRSMESMGLVVVRPGEGTFLAQPTIMQDHDPFN
jgi:GntR family transcriptional repressor for pyruvate dehydrogenase complex